MKLVVLAAGVMACALPVFGQDAHARHPQLGVQTLPAVAGRPTPRHERDDCRPSNVVSPAVTGWIILPSVPVASSTGAGFAQWSSAPRPTSIFSQPASGIGSLSASGIGSMDRSGVGAMQSSGIGTMERSGIGAIGMPSAGPSPNVVTQPPPASIRVPTCR